MSKHREYYPKERLHRYGLIDSPLCPRCDQVDDYDHKLYDCIYTRKIWEEVFKLTDKLNSLQTNGVTLQNKVIGSNTGLEITGLTIHAEILTRILRLKDETNYLIRTKNFVKLTMDHLIKREIKVDIRQSLKDLLRDD